MRVGPKGQVVIPQALRSEFGIDPGAEVIFDHARGNITIQKAKSNLVAVFEALAAQAKPAKVDICHGVYEQYEARWQRRKST